MRPKSRQAHLIVVLLVMVAPVAMVTTGAVASPPPGPANPWQENRIAAIAHAGGEDENPQETLYAFGRDVQSGVPVLDMDVQFSADGIPVVIHDNTVDRTTNGSGAVSSMTYAQIHALDAAYWYSDDCAACHGKPESDYVYRGVRTGAKPPPVGFTADDFGVPSLEDVFRRFPDAYFSIEIKDNATDVTALARATAELIHTYGLTKRTVVSSFGGPGMPAFRAAAPDVATSATLDEVQAFFLQGTVPMDAQVLDVPPTYTVGGTKIQVVTPEFVTKAHDAGLAVWVWMDSPSQQNASFYSELLDMGVDGLNVSRPSVLMQVLAERGGAWDPGAPPPSSSTVVPTSTPSTVTTAPPSPPGSAPVATAHVAQPSYTG